MTLETAISPTVRPMAGMFPGLGDHYVNMALGLYTSEPIFRAHVDRCCELLVPEVGLDLRTILYPPRQPQPDPPKASTPAPGGLDLRRMFGRQDDEPDADTQRLNQTHLTQPALFVIESALAALWQSRGPQLSALIGYSLGEYVACCLAGVLRLEDALKLVARRAQLIAKLPSGSMLAVPLSEARVLQMLGAHLSLCAINGPEFCVVGGPHEAIEALRQRLHDDGTVSRRVQTSHAFHSKMMEPIAEPLTRLIASLQLQPPRIPCVSNVTGALLTAAQATDPGYYALHLLRPVRFADGIRRLLQDPARSFVELGPGQTLCSLVQQNAPPAESRERLMISTLRHAYDNQPDTEILAQAMARLALTGRATPPTSPATRVDTAAVSAAPAMRPPQSEVEQTLAGIWQELLRKGRIGLDDHFFDRGGNSLLATRVILRIRKSFGVDLPLRRLYATPTLAGLAAAVEGLIAVRDGKPAATSPPASPLAGPPSATPRLLPFVLPDGTEIVHQSEAESRHFYHDIFEQRSYVKHGIRIPDGGCVFDVGANLGMFTLFASREARNVRLYSFEPAPPLFALLSHNVARHQVSAKLFNLGLSDKERTAEFTFYPNSSGMSSFHADMAEEKHVLRAIMKNQEQRGMADMEQIAEHTEALLDARFTHQIMTCQLRRLGDVIADQRIDRIDLLKVDVQKCEHEVLAGLKDDDWPKIRQIVIEVHDIDGRLAQLQSQLENRGYRAIAEQDPLYAGTNIHNLYAMRA